MEPGDWQPRHVMIGTDLCTLMLNMVESMTKYNSNMHITRG